MIKWRDFNQWIRNTKSESDLYIVIQIFDIWSIIILSCLYCMKNRFYLDPYIPSEEEKADPALFANNVRSVSISYYYNFFPLI